MIIVVVCLDLEVLLILLIIPLGLQPQIQGRSPADLPWIWGISPMNTRGYAIWGSPGLAMGWPWGALFDPYLSSYGLCTTLDFKPVAREYAILQGLDLDPWISGPGPWAGLGPGPALGTPDLTPI